MSAGSVRVGAFLKEKLMNLAVWVTNTIGKENINMDIEQFVNRRSEVEITFFADILSTNSVKVIHRDWMGLVGILESDATIPRDVADSFITILQLVRQKEEMHDKFWRYMELFRDVVERGRDEIFLTP